MQPLTGGWCWGGRVAGSGERRGQNGRRQDGKKREDQSVKGEKKRETLYFRQLKLMSGKLSLGRRKAFFTLKMVLIHCSCHPPTLECPWLCEQHFQLDLVEKFVQKPKALRMHFITLGCSTKDQFLVAQTTLWPWKVSTVDRF